MLRFLRTKATSFLIKALFGMIIAVFIFWGIGGFRRTEVVVAEVGKYRIYKTDYYEEYRRLADFYRKLLKDNLNEDASTGEKIKKKAIENLIDRYLLLILSEKTDIYVSDIEYLEHISNIEAFKVNGRFDKKRFLEVLRAKNVDPKDFERKERISLGISKFSEILKDLLVSVDEKEVWDEYLKENGMVRFRYSVFSPEDFMDKVQIKEEEIASRYEKEKNLYFSEPLYTIKYIVIDEKKGIKDDHAYMELIKTRDLDSFAKAHGLNLHTLGPLSEGELRKKLPTIKDFSWLKDLRTKDISLPVRSDGASYIFQVVDYKKGEPLEKATVVKILREKILIEKAKELAKNRAYEVLQSNRYRFEKITDFIPRNSSAIPKIGPIPEEHRGLFQLNTNTPVYTSPIEISGKFYVFSFDSEKIPAYSGWQSKKKEYRLSLLLKKREEKLKAFIDSFREKEKIKIFWQEI